MRALVAASLVFALACDGPHAGVEITGARAARVEGDRVVVDVDVRAYESMGQNIGVYCVRATFPHQPRPAEECRADLRDGDTRTFRLTSDGPVWSADPIVVRVRHAATDTVRHLAVP